MMNRVMMVAIAEGVWVMLAGGDGAGNFYYDKPFRTKVIVWDGAALRKEGDMQKMEGVVRRSGLEN